MKLTDFDYFLDESKIAQKPVFPRDTSKLLIIDRTSSKKEEKIFKEIIDILWENDVLVFNETKVIKARLKWYVELQDGRKKEVEILLLSQKDLSSWECQVFPWERLKIWKEVYFENKLIWRIKEMTYAWRIIEFNIWWNEFYEIIDQIWEIPLPPYIKMENQTIEEYNTVYASREWSAAAPTAWLHFTFELLEKIKNKWVKIEKVLLHIWLWTFKPITVDEIKNHEIHKEYVFIDSETSERLNKYKSDWKRIIAVWTTTTRVLESFTDEKWILSYWEKETEIFIYPWYKFRFIDSIITNFHLPKSSLLLMISAFYDRKKLLETYEYAKENNYRFFSFWDAMWIK